MFSDPREILLMMFTEDRPRYKLLSLLHLSCGMEIGLPFSLAGRSKVKTLPCHCTTAFTKCRILVKLSTEPCLWGYTTGKG